jgi:ABC-type glycerol-3-phosphate transport system substrate-binding protein
VIWGTLPQAAVTQELGALSSTNKSFSKVTYVQQQAATFDNDLANAIASGDGPDMIIMDQEQLLEEQSKLNIIPYSAIPQRTFTDSYLPEDNLFLTTTGTYGVPYVLDPLVLYYNTTLLSQAGIAVPPSSWEAVTGLAPTLTKLSSAQFIAQSAIALGTYDNIENARAILSLLFFQAGSSITQVSTADVRSVLGGQQNTTTAPSTSSTSGTPASSALNFYTQFADPSRTVYSWNESFQSAQQAFIAGNLAMYVGFASEEPVLKAANPNLPFDMAQIPQLQAASTKTDYALAYAFAIPKASKNPSGAFLTAQALSSATQLPTVAAALSMAPSQRALLTTSPSDAFSPVYYPEALISTGWLSPAPATTDSVFSAMISNITSGRLQTQDALYTADQALDAALPSSSQ